MCKLLLDFYATGINYIILSLIKTFSPFQGTAGSWNVLQHERPQYQNKNPKIIIIPSPAFTNRLIIWLQPFNDISKEIYQVFS